MRPDTGWRFNRLFDAPHRLAFAAATWMLMLISLWWAMVNLAGGEGVAMHWAMAPATAHSLLMTFGFMPLYFIGFLFTAGPKWLGRPAAAARDLLAPLAAQVVGWMVFMLAIHGRDPVFGQSVGAIGLGAVVFGWAGVIRRYLSMWAASRVADRVHPTVVAVGCVFGLIALAVAAAGVAMGDPPLVHGATHAALWGFVGLVFATVAHRMIPFFSAAAVPSLDAWRPLWLLWCFVAVFALEAAFAALDAVATIAPHSLQIGRAAAEGLTGIGLLALAVRWGLVQSLRVRLLAMLHLGFTWLGIGLLLSGVSHAVAAAGGAPALLGLAPLHAYTMGFLGSTMFAMVTRVSCGHGGRTLAADDFVWRLFWVLQLAIVARLVAAVLREASAAWSVALIAAAAVGWAGVCLAWGARYGHWYGTPRPDGRPG
ncbi:NnrS family protein [Aquincola sp. S2]|uniref:NnrS family protein n=1 Tax=Pseudaquabacterium terrae TaxID=2732868 RepID=A0ABX2EQW3_9BURK|nr:NnrS family protein [Aquabacterium terrae]NRF71013.1 NnrS family protein [Aquabacterium terrae]